MSRDDPRPGARRATQTERGEMVRLRPHHRVPQDPTGGLQGERHPPRHTKQVLARQRGRSAAGRQLAAAGDPAGGVVGQPAAGGVAVAEVHPAGPGRGEYPAGLVEHRDQVVEVLVQAGFEAVPRVYPARLTCGAGDAVGAAGAAQRVTAGRVAAVPGAGAVVAQPPERGEVTRQSTLASGMAAKTSAASPRYSSTGPRRR